jgi:hypothetical protein
VGAVVQVILALQQILAVLAVAEQIMVQHKLQAQVYLVQQDKDTLGAVVVIIATILIQAAVAEELEAQEYHQIQLLLTVQVVLHINGLMEYIMRVAVAQVPVIKEQVV